MSTAPSPFQRPDEWPQGHLADNGIQCPQCGTHDGISVVATTWVTLTDEGSIDGDHEYGPDSTAACSNCSWRGTYAEVCMIPNVALPLRALWVEWDTPSDGWGSARWGSDRLADTPTSMRAYEIVTHYWPGVRIDSAPDGVTVECNDDALVDALCDDLNALLGDPDTLM